MSLCIELISCDVLVTGDCLGSFCDLKYHPSICSPKTIKQVSVRCYCTVN
jgi:hypothetical protein